MKPRQMLSRLIRWGWVTVALGALLLPFAALAWDAADDASAHAALVSSSPENGSQERRPPARVILNFSEPVEPKLTEIDVFDVDRNEVDENDVVVNDDDRRQTSVGVPTLGPGLYTVEFSNVSTVDGHPWSGVLQFIVLNPDGSVPANAEFDADPGGGSTAGLLPRNLDAALKWFAIVALAITVGATVFAAAVLRPAASFLEDDDFAEAQTAAESWVVVAAHILLPLSFIAAALLVVISVNRFETSLSLFDYLTTVRSGRYQLANLICIVIALVGADVAYLTGNQRLKAAGLGILVIASTMAVLTYSMISHGATGEGRFWSITSDFIHFLASSLWLGALVLLVPLLRWSRTSLSSEAVRFLYLANAFDRFSLLAGLSVFAVMTTGLFNGLVEIETWSALTSTTYGRVLLAKLIIVGLLLPVAALNAFVLKPRLVATIDSLYQSGVQSRSPGGERRLAGLQRLLPATVITEIVLVLAVFGAVAVLTQTSTARGELAQEEAAQGQNTDFRDTRPAADLQLGILIEPSRVGINRYTLSVRNQDGSPAATVTQARLRFTYVDPSQPDVQQPAAELLLRPSFVEGEFEGQGAYFTQAGSWQVEAGIRRSDADDVSRVFSVPVAPGISADAGTEGGPFALPFASDALQWNHVAGAALVLLGVLGLLYRERLRGIARESYRVGVTAATASILAGAVLWFGVDTHSAVADPSAGNPVPATDESVAAGRALFQQNCVVCHGPEGRGDGPEAANLNPAPVDLRRHLPLHIDAQFFAFIANGLPGTAMPAFRDQLSDEDIWNLINFMRAEFQVADTE